MWLAIRFTFLPLEALAIKMTRSAQVVAENNLIICANNKAVLQGVKHHQNISIAYALCREVDIFERNLNQEKQYLHNMALLVYAYTPSVAIEGDQLLLAEIGHSLKLYGSLENLLALLTQELDQEKSNYQLGLGDNPKTAELSSYYPPDASLPSKIRNNWTLNKAKTHKRLSKLPINLLNIPKKTIRQLQSVGIKSLGELEALPQNAIKKRFGKDLSEYLLKLSGAMIDPKIYLVPKENFYEKLDFLNVVHHRQGLLFPIKRLLKDLCRFLSIKQKTSQCLHWQLYDSEKNSIGFNVLVSGSCVSTQTYFELTQLNLERYRLHAPIEAISLTVDRLSELVGKTKALFGQANGFKEETDFINKVRAKLGVNSCYSLHQRAEHLPELSSQKIINASSTDIANTSCSKSVLFKNKPILENLTTSPSWLFEAPKLVQFINHRLSWHGELKIISQKERIISHWWKQKSVRDYFLAEHDNGVIYWVFFERIKKQWFIQGIYS